MEIKILQVFYGKDGLPYKDKDRQVHFPIAGTGFLGASNTTKIKFYYDELDNLDETTWVAVSKLPNGKIGSRVLESYTDSELNEHYALLELDSYYTQYKGDVFISLQGYQGGVNLDYNEETSQYEIHGTPTIAATGSIKFTINYANQFVGSGETDNVNMQRILADLGTKIGIRTKTEYVEELPNVGDGDTYYIVHDDPNYPNKYSIYFWNNETKHYIWVGDNTIDLSLYATKEQVNNVNNKVGYLENEISSLANGSPKGVYSTLEDLQTAHPTGDNNIYLVGTHWYYWNTSTSSWTDGGEYLSSGEDVDKLKNQMGFVLTDHAFFYNENVTVTGTGIYESKSYFFNVSFEETTKVTLKIDDVIGYTTNDCLYLYALDENDQTLAVAAIYMTGTKEISINCPNTTARIKVQFYPASGTAMPTGSATYYGVLCYWGDIPRYIESSKLYPSLSTLENKVDELEENVEWAITDHSFIYNKDIVVNGDSTYVYKNYDFEVNFETQTKVTLHIDNVIGNTTTDCAYLWALDENGDPISYIAIYWGTRDTVSLDCPTTTKKIRVQLYPASGTAMPTGTSTFYGVLCYYGNVAKYIDSSKVYPNFLHVGSGYQFTTIQSAVNAANDGDTIIVHDGTYNESVKVYGTTGNMHTSAKNIRIIGTNRDSCILTHDISDYYNPPLEIAMGYVENLTIIGTGPTTPGGSLAYCVHMDYGTSMYKNIQFNNCRFVNTQYPCVGTGLREGQKELFVNCVFECDGGAAFLFHEDQNNNITNQYITFDGCTFISNSDYDGTIHVQETASYSGNSVSVTFRKCIVKQTNNGPLAKLWELNNGTLNGSGWLGSNIYHLTVDSDLNSDEVFDYGS